MKRTLVIAGMLVLMLAGSASAQTIGYTRLDMLHLVRDIIGEPQATYYADSTINRLLSYAQGQTKAVMGGATTTAILRQSMTAGQVHWPLPAGAIDGSSAVIGVLYWDNSHTTLRGLREVPTSLAGRVEGAYSLVGNVINLGFEPQASDSIIVYYINKATDLSADGTSLSVSDEDALAIANLAISMLLHRDKQVSEAQVFYQMWKDYVDRKGAGTVSAGGGQ